MLEEVTLFRIFTHTAPLLPRAKTGLPVFDCLEHLNFKLMKIFLSSIIVALCTTSFAQINQRTANLRKQYSELQPFQLKVEPLQMSFNRNLIQYKFETTESPMLSTELRAKPSMHSIEKAFNYYNSLKKPADYSGFVMMGYSMITNKALINNTPQESIRFFPANSKD